MKKYLVITLVIVLVVLLIAINKGKKESFKVYNEVPSDYLNIKSDIDENSKYYMFEKDKKKYILFKISKYTYKSSIEIIKIKQEKVVYNDKRLDITLNIEIKEGESDPYRDWPLTAFKYVVMEVSNFEELYINDVKYEKI